jgi:hypothetical protein
MEHPSEAQLRLAAAVGRTQQSRREIMEEASGWVFAVILGPVLLGAILAFGIARNRRRRSLNTRSPSYDEGEPGGRGRP